MWSPSQRTSTSFQPLVLQPSRPCPSSRSRSTAALAFLVVDTAPPVAFRHVGLIALDDEIRELFAAELDAAVMIAEFYLRLQMEVGELLFAINQKSIVLEASLRPSIRSIGDSRLSRVSGRLPIPSRSCHRRADLNPPPAALRTIPPASSARNTNRLIISGNISNSGPIASMISYNRYYDSSCLRRRVTVARSLVSPGPISPARKFQTEGNCQIAASRCGERVLSRTRFDWSGVDPKPENEGPRILRPVVREVRSQTARRHHGPGGRVHD